MVFPYYRKLTPDQKRIYRASDAIASLAVPDADTLRPPVAALADALGREDREEIETLCRVIARGLADRLAVRPSAAWGELHGLYEPAQGRASAVITLWMRTAKQKRVVAFRSFLRTLLHEFCHHLDYAYFHLPDSFHTEGFYRRESSLFHQLAVQEPEGD